MALEAQFQRFTSPSGPLFSYTLAGYIYHFKRELSYRSIQLGPQPLDLLN
jgi:hypothetical protein